MKITQVHVEYLARLSNGNYGSEEHRFALGADLEAFDDPEGCAEELSERCRQLAEEQFLKSRFKAVRDAVRLKSEVDPTDNPF